ncbi:hypothetical protein [Breznakia pachnodae]|uniref:Uncharacterized protein n=1 Tax=Breznakia pachnodae TaxID=265178 RepID=A0ABU0E540_9FIRM|nr:hypothetical protein [Breznakia pachnodae]MDQ0362026.1 hypothetical protein [Breznakia pachnodae]
MILYNSVYEVEITEITKLELTTFKYDKIFDYMKLIDSEFSKIWNIFINKSNMILVAHMSAPCSCILHESELIILLDGYIVILDLNTYEMTAIDDFKNHGCFFAIYEYDEGYIIHGELEIIKLSNDFKIEWSFSGSDIFVRADGTECFRIIDDKVEVRCWDGLEVLLDIKGKVIKETYNK